MAAAEVAAHSATDRQSRRTPFTSWVKRITHLKPQDVTKKSSIHHRFIPKKVLSGKPHDRNGAGPYSESGYVQQARRMSDITTESEHRPLATPDASASMTSLPTNGYTQTRVTPSHQSISPTVATIAETVHSEAGQSKAMTSKTGGAFSSVDATGVNSTFSSPAQSQKSMATTLTTIQSTSPQHMPGQADNAGRQVIGPSPLSAVPQHLIPSGPSTYNGATANNLLTDDASILTLASSSKKARRRSMDTDASILALAPSIMSDNRSQESLSLSVLSSALDAGSISGHGSQNRSGLGTADRTGSVYSSQSVAAPALTSERNSYYASNLANRTASIKDRDNRSIDGRSMHNKDLDDAKSLSGGRSLHGSESLKTYEGSMRSGFAVRNAFGPPSRANSLVDDA